MAEEKKRERIYKIELPFTASGFALWFAVNKFKSSPSWSKLPAHLRERIEAANNSWTGQLVITKHDLDEIDEETWEELAEEFDIPYAYEEFPDAKKDK